jgi:poly(3-hydroxybutyrate) depolymerase
VKTLLWKPVLALCAVVCLTACGDSSSSNDSADILTYSNTADLPDTCEKELAKVEDAYFACFENKWIEVTDSLVVETLKEDLDEAKIKEILEDLKKTFEEKSAKESQQHLSNKRNTVSSSSSEEPEGTSSSEECTGRRCPKNTSSSSKGKSNNNGDSGLDDPLPGSSTSLSSSSESVEMTYAFGYAIGNAPTPSKGCGKENTLKDYFTFTGGGVEHEVYLSMPENYDKNKPYRLVFGFHYMGGSAEAVAKRENYYGLRNQPGANENTIFVAPHGYTDENGTEKPWRCGDDKDHLFFDEFLTYLNENLCVDTSRVFAVGFSFGAMIANALAQDFQERLRGVVVYATMDQVIYMPKNKGLPIAWMGTVGMSDDLCTPKLGRSARDRILKNNGIPDGEGNFTDARGEAAEEYTGSGNHVCYDYKTVDPRFPVKWCTFDGEHTYTPREDGKVWTTEVGWEFITQF